LTYSEKLDFASLTLISIMFTSQGLNGHYGLDYTSLIVKNVSAFTARA
jgi:hypothetical protein